jgi:MFS family permease
VLSTLEDSPPFWRAFLEGVPVRTKKAGNSAQGINAARNPSHGACAVACRSLGVLSTTSGPLVVAAVFCLVFLVMGTAFSFSAFASDLERDLEAGSGAISFIFGCSMALLYAGGLFSGALADRIGTHRVAGAGALLAGGSLVAAGAVGRVWEADVTLGLGFGLGLAVCYTPAVVAVQPARVRGVRYLIRQRIFRP